MNPVSILIKPASSLCNMRCKYCFYADVSDNRNIKSYGIMSLETLELLIKKVFEYASGYATFGFQGGEPTLAGIGFFKKVLEFQKKYNINNIQVINTLQTNGYLINDEWAQFFSENQFLIGISLDGIKEVHDSLRLDSKGMGTYSKVLNAIKLFDKYHVEYNILCVVNNFVARHPQKVYENLKKYKYIQFIPCLNDFDCNPTKFSLTPERYTEFLNTTFKLYYNDFMSGNYVSVRNFDNYINMLAGKEPENCAMRGFCTCYFVIEADGSVYPCDFYVLDEWKLGDIHENSFSELKKNNLAYKFVQMSKFVDSECNNCKFYQLCRSGCRRERNILPDNTIGNNIFCESYKIFFEQNYQLMLEMVQKLIFMH